MRLVLRMLLGENWKPMFVLFVGSGLLAFRWGMFLTFFNCYGNGWLEAQGVKERKLAGWGLSRGKAWKGSLNVTEKNAPQMEANTGIMEDAPTMKLFSSCCIWRRSRQPKWNGSWKASKLCILPGFHSPVMQKTLQIPLFLTRWTERGLNPRPQGYKPPGGGGGLSLIVSGNARIQPLAYSLLKQEELQLA